MAVTYRTSGPWGPGKGENLTPTEVDTNFWQLVQDVAAKAAQGTGIANFNVTGDQLTVVLTDHTLLGPYTLPKATLTFMGEWLPHQSYYANDILTHGGSTYLVLINHTSEATFDPAANDGSGNNFYGLLLENPTAAVSAGGAAGQVLTKASSADYDTHWTWETLAGLHDVLSTPAPEPGDLVYWNGAAFSYVALADLSGAGGGSGGTGTVTSITAGTGLTTGGPPITITGTIALGTIDNNTLLANISGASAAPAPSGLSLILDTIFSATQGAILCRGATGWGVLGPGTSGQFLETGGSGANAFWANPTSATPIAAANLLANLTTGTTTALGHTLSSILDYVVSATQGTLLFRGATGWTGLAPGSAGYLLAAGGTGADLSWTPPPTGVSTTASVTAAGTNQSTAAPMTATQNYVTGADGTKGVKVDPALMSPGQQIFVVNEDASHILPLYPPSGGTINTQSANTSINVYPNGTALFIVKTTTALRSVP